MGTDGHPIMNSFFYTKGSGLNGGVFPADSSILSPVPHVPVKTIVNIINTVTPMKNITASNVLCVIFNIHMGKICFFYRIK